MKQAKKKLKHDGSGIRLPSRKQFQVSTKKFKEDHNSEEPLQVVKKGNFTLKGNHGLRWSKTLTTKKKNSARRTNSSQSPLPQLSTRGKKLDDALLDSINFDNLMRNGECLEFGSNVNTGTPQNDSFDYRSLPTSKDADKKGKETYISDVDDKKPEMQHSLVVTSDSDQDLKIKNMQMVKMNTRPSAALRRVPGMNKVLLLGLNLQNIVNYNSRFVSSTFSNVIR